MKNLLRIVVCLFMCVSLNSFGFVQSQIINLQFDTFQVENPNFSECDFFSICEEPEVLNLDYVSAINPGWVSYSISHGNEFNITDDFNSLDIEITNFDSGFLLNGRWGWNSTQQALRYDNCTDSGGSSQNQCNFSWNQPALKEVYRHIDDGDSLYISAFHVGSYDREKLIDLMVGEPIDRVAFWNEYYGYITPEEYYATTVPLPAGIYLFLSGLVGLGLMRRRETKR